MEEQKMDGENLTKQQRRLLRKEEKMQNRARRERVGIVKKILLFGLLFIIAGGGIFGVVQFGSQGNSQTASLADAFAVQSENEWIRGNTNATTTIIEYSDFQCPACAWYEPILQGVVKEYGERIRLVYRNFPLPQHGEAKPAAYAAEAAGAQGKYWEMHDMIFARQTEWAEKSNAREKFEGYAETLGLDMARFKIDMESDAVKEKVENDLLGALTMNISSTPTFFLNGKQISPRSADEFKAAVNAVLE